MKPLILFILLLFLGFSAHSGSEKLVSPITVELKIFPNPNPGEILKISSSSVFIQKVQITNITGRLVLVKNFDLPESTQKLNVDILTNGIYLVKITTVDGQTFTQKLIISKD